MTGQADVAVAVAAMKAGAVDFIEKPCIADDILALVHRVTTLPKPADHPDPVDPEAAARIDRLTPRERSVLHYLVVGHSNKAIAFELNISPRTVEIHRSNVMKKMAAHTLSHLVRLAMASGVSLI